MRKNKEYKKDKNKLRYNKISQQHSKHKIKLKK